MGNKGTEIHDGVGATSTGDPIPGPNTIILNVCGWLY